LVQALLKEIHPSRRQYIIAVHPVEREGCEALLDNNVIHIYIPEKQIKNERE
jgi:hypothetical protein